MSTRKVRIRTLDQDGANEEFVDLEFADDEWETLQDFAKYAGQLENNPLIKEGIPSSLNVNWTEGEGLKVDTKLPSDDQIDAMLMKLRPFLLNDEGTNFNRVRNIVKRAANNQRVRKHLDTLQHLYSGERLQSLFVAGAYSQDQDPKVINSEEMLQHWLNGDRFHKDKGRKRILDAMHGIMPEESSIALFLFLITDKVTAIIGLQRVVALFAGEREEICAPIILEEPIHYLVFLHASVAQFDMFDLEKDDPRPLPQEGEPFAEKVFDLTHMGPAMFHQFLDPVGQIWMHGGMIYDIGEHRYFFRVAPGFKTENGKVAEFGADIIATVKTVVFLVEEPFSRARRKPAQEMLERMQAQKEGRTSTKVVLKAIETQDELDRILNKDPQPRVEYIVVPRIAFMFAYWPISDQARERFRRIVSEGRNPTFEEVEGTDILRAWEIFEKQEEGGVDASRGRFGR